MLLKPGCRLIVAPCGPTARTIQVLRRHCPDCPEPARLPIGRHPVEQSTSSARTATLQRALMRRSVNSKKSLPDPTSLKGNSHEDHQYLLAGVWTGQFRSKPCSHVHLARADIGPASEVCVEWHLETHGQRFGCACCVVTSVATTSQRTSTPEHFRQTGHPLTRPYKERGMDWVWCYVDEALLDPI
jgi:hypothetical protein